jgi:hypothetical protein
MKSKPVSATSAIALQRWLRPALTPVGANKDYAEFRQQLEGLDGLLRGSHLETMAMDFAKAGAGQASVAQLRQRMEFALKALRFEVLRVHLGNISFRELSRSIASSDLLADFCGVRTLEGIKGVSKSVLERASKFFTAEQVRWMGQVLVEMWRAVGLNVQIEMKENWQQIFDTSSQRGIRDWSNSAAFNDPVSSLVNQHGPNGQQQQMGEWTNEEMNRLSVELETSTDRARRRAVFRRLLEIAEREDPAYTVLHQNATFTAKRKDIRWKASPAFAMDFRPGNYGN